MRTQAIVWSLLIVVVLLAIAGFIATHDRVTAKQWIGPTGEARLRPFLAAQRFAERMGLKVAEVRALPELQSLPPRGVLLVPGLRQELHPTKLAELARWVERGGHLVVEAEALGVPDPLLAELAVGRSQAETLSKPFGLELPRAGRTLTVFLPEAMQLEAPAGATRLNAAGRVVSFPRGAGMVTAAASLRFARNPGYEDHIATKTLKVPPRSIGAYDHAELLWHVLTLTPSAELQVYFRPERLSLWGFLRSHAPYAVASIVLLLALWLWSIVPRFGPIAPDAPPGRRRLLDHLRASGRYLWVSGLRSRLVVAARDAALRRMARAQPDFASASTAEKAARLSSLAKMTKEEAARFMVAAGAMRGADFIKVTQHAQRVHSALEKGNK
jgi:hypothetical protein